MSKLFKNSNIKPNIVTINQPIKAVGLTVKTSMNSVFKDVSKIVNKYMDYKDKYDIPNQKIPWEYVSLSKNFNDNNTWDYLTGHVVDYNDNVPDVFVSFEIPAGTYAVFKVRPKIKFMLGLAIGKTKKYIYKNWLPASQYEFGGYEFEYNDEGMFKVNPHFIDLYVAVKTKK